MDDVTPRSTQIFGADVPHFDRHAAETPALWWQPVYDVRGPYDFLAGAAGSETSPNRCRIHGTVP